MATVVCVCVCVRMCVCVCVYVCADATKYSRSLRYSGANLMIQSEAKYTKHCLPLPCIVWLINLFVCRRWIYSLVHVYMIGLTAYLLSSKSGQV